MQYAPRMIRQGRKKEPVGLCLFPKGDKYRHLDSIIRSSRIVCGAYAFAPCKRGCAPRPHPPRLSPVGAICGAYAIRPYVGGCAPRPHPPHLSPVGAICGAYAIRPYRQGWRLVFLSPFLSLMKEKEAKENQGVRDASQIYRVRDVSMWCTRPFFPAPAGAVRDASQIGRVRDVSMWCTPPFFPAPAGAVRDASQIYRVRDVGRTCVPARWMGFDRAAYVLRPLTVLCDPLYKCAGRLRVLVGWGRGVIGRVWGLNGLHIIY